MTNRPMVSLVWAAPNGDQLITDIARVSSPENVGKEPMGLIRFMIRHRHWSPFEMVSACIEINTSMDVGEQILRHRSFSFQKFSFRYSDVEKLRERPRITVARIRSKKNRQSSSGIADAATQELWQRLQLQVFSVTSEAYREAVAAGIPFEQARGLLPIATPTRMYMAGTLRSFLHYLEVRMKSDVQQEHREVAQAIAAVIREAFPIAFEAWEKSQALRRLTFKRRTRKAA